MLTAVDGVLLEPLGTECAAFSPLSGASHLLNDTSAALIDLVMDRGAGAEVAEADVIEALCAEAGADAAGHSALIERHWGTLVAAGLLRRRTV